MNEGDLDKTSKSSAMDIVSMAFSNVSGTGDLMEVVNTVSDPVADGQVAVTADGQHVVHCIESQADVPDQSDQERPDHIEIPLPHNAIITVNDQGEQIIELAEVVDEDHDQNCVIDHVEQPDQTSADDVQPRHDGDITLTDGGNDLETMAFQDQDVGDEPCVVPVTISLADVQNIQEVVAVTSERTAHVSVGHVVTTTGMSGLSASSLLGSFANIIDTRSVLTNSNMASSSSFPICSAYSGGTGMHTNKTSILGTTVVNSPSTAAQFIHNGTNLQAVSINDSVLPRTSLNQSLNNAQTTSIVGPVMSTNQMVNLPPVQKSDPLTVIGNRSVFSPMTLTIRTPPGAPAVNQALINSIVNNTEVQALLKRNPGQPITIVRVPEDPFEKRNRLGLNAKIITTSSSTVPSKPGRPRKDITMTGNNSIPKKFTGKRRGRQPGIKLHKKEEEYVPPVWKPVRSRTRSGRISRPPIYRTENFKTLPLVDRPDSRASDDEGLSDTELDDGSRELVTLSGRWKRFKCQKCSKAYIGKAGLARHFSFEPTHGNIEDYEKSEKASKADASTSDDVLNKTDRLENSETNNVQLLEGRTDISETPADEPAKETAPELETKGRRGRQPNSTKDDPNFRPGMSAASKGSFKSKEKRKDTMRNALRFLNNEDYMDVCLPRLARALSPWEFLLSKAETTKDESSEVLKILQLFEELVSEVREMALNCLEKADDDDPEAEGIFLDEDDDLARVLDFEKGWYKVSEPPPGVTDLPFRYKLLEAEGVASTLKRTVEVISKDDIDDDREPLYIKKVKLEKNQVTKQKPPLKIVAPPKKIMPSLGPVSQPKSFLVHTPKQDSLVTSTIGKPAKENEAPSTSDQANTSNSKDNQECHMVTTKSTIPASQMPKLSSDGMTPLDQKQQTNTEPSVTASENEQTSGNEERVRLQPSMQSQPSILAAPLGSEQQSITGQIPESPDGQQQVSWPGESVADPSDIGAQFIQAAEELVSLATTADVSHGEMRDEGQSAHQEDTSVVVPVPEGSTIMQMQDGTFLVQRPDGTAMQIHTPEGMTIETVQELLSMEAGQG